MVLYEEKSKFSSKDTDKFYTTDRKEFVQINLGLDKYTYFDYSISFSLISDMTNRLNPFEKVRDHYYLTSFK
jgi:hypothetical protein